MNRYKETFKTWNKIAALYQNKFMDLDLYNDTYDVFCDLLKEMASILELGCGPGNIARYILSNCPDVQFHGTDIAPNMVTLAQKNNPSAHFSILDSRNIDSLDSQYDGMICGFVLPYLSEDDRKKLIKDAANLLFPQGILYLSFVEGSYNQSGYQKGSTNDNRVYFYFHESQQVQQELLDLDFEILHCINIEYERPNSTEIHVVLMAKKR